MKARRIIRRLAAPLVAMSVASLSLLGLTATPASADSRVQGCTYDTCVDAYTGSKNYSNHTQWVGYVDVYNSGGSTQLQMWTYGTYQEANNVSYRRFWVGRWVPSGNNVCGATVRGGVRRVACISISV